MILAFIQANVYEIRLRNIFKFHNRAFAFVANITKLFDTFLISVNETYINYSIQESYLGTF